MLRVAVDATPLLGEQTGIGVLVSGLLERLAGRPEFDLAAFGLTWRGRQALRRAVPAGVSVVRWPMAAAALQELWARIDGPVIEWWTGPVDVVHGTNFVVPPAANAAEVVSVHDMTAFRFPELCAAATLRYPDLIRRAIGRGAWVHTLSHAVADEIVSTLGAAPERVRVVCPAVDLVPPGAAGDEATPPVDQAPPGAAAPGDEATPATDSGAQAATDAAPYLLALGRAEPRKDLPLLVRAFDRIAAKQPDLRLLIAGPTGWGDAALDAAIGTARHSGRIERLGAVGPTRKWELLRGAVALAYPSVYEGFGIPPLEAMAVGVPVVATTAGGLAEAVGDAALVVPVGDADALAAALASVVADDDLRSRLVAAGREQATKFTWSRCVDGFVGLYRDAAASR